MNGGSVSTKQLDPGDRISIGESVLVFLVKDEAPEASVMVEFEDYPAEAPAKFRSQDILYLQPERILRQKPATSILGQNLSVLLKIGRVVQSISDLDELQAHILKLIFEAVPAEHGVILLDRNGKNRALSLFAYPGSANRGEPVRWNRTITRQAMEQGVAILGADMLRNEIFSQVESLAGFQVRSLLCVPVTLFQKVLGCIYLDTTSSARRFGREHLELVAGIANISAVALENARRPMELEKESLRLKAEVRLQHNMIGKSTAMKEVYHFLSRVAPTESTVLICGESGTGKELAARAIHHNSPRAGRPFVAINCAAIPEGLLESELFGYERGAFTGAASQKKGRLEMADRGVVFLDEIGELAPALQVKLLRVLQEREFERLGGSRPISVDIRLVAATNKDLALAVKAGTFREDLYYRLNVISVVLPKLCQRVEDIPILAEYFVAKFAARCKTKPAQISVEAMAALMNYDWPGNVRELENAVERALVLGAHDTILPEDLPQPARHKNLTSESPEVNYRLAVSRLKKELIVKALEETGGNYTEAARVLGVHANYLHRLVRKLNLRNLNRAFPIFQRDQGREPGTAPEKFTGYTS